MGCEGKTDGRNWKVLCFSLYELSSLRNSMEIEIRTENKNKEQRKNKLDSMSFIKCIPKAKKNKRKFTLFHPQMGLKNKTSFVQKRATNNLQLFTIGKHTQNSSVFPLTNKITKSTKPTMTTQHPHIGKIQFLIKCCHIIHFLFLFLVFFWFFFGFLFRTVFFFLFCLWKRKKKRKRKRKRKIQQKREKNKKKTKKKDCMTKIDWKNPNANQK